MTIANFSGLKTQVRSFFTDRSDVPAIVYDLAAAELNARLNLRIMETETDLSATSGNEEISLPSDFLRVRHAYLDRDSRKVLDAADEFGKNIDYRSSGEPAVYSIIDGKMLLNPVPDGGYTVTLRYITKLSDFSADGDTNAVLTTHPALYLYASLKHAGIWAQDLEMSRTYEAALEQEIRRVQRQDDLARYGTGPLRTRTAHAP